MTPIGSDRLPQNRRALPALLAANIAGYRFDLYKAAWWFDRALHGSTLLALTFWLAIVVFARGIRERHRILGFFRIAAVGVACGALWEVAEWASDQFQPADVIKVKYDSILDIIMDTLGALIAAGLALPFLVEDQNSTSSAVLGLPPDRN